MGDGGGEVGAQVLQGGGGGAVGGADLNHVVTASVQQQVVALLMWQGCHRPCKAGVALPHRRARRAPYRNGRDAHWSSYGRDALHPDKRAMWDMSFSHWGLISSFAYGKIVRDGKLYPKWGLYWHD